MVLIYIHPSVQINYTDKGRGFITTSKLNKNEIVLIEQPECYIEHFIESPLYETLYQIIINLKLDEFNKLTPHKIDYIDTDFINELKKIKNYKIKKIFEKFNDYELSLLVAKYKQNVFNMDNTKHKIKPCVLFYGCIFNHSCSPNIDFHFDYSKKYMIFKTNQNININTELYDTYININLNFNERQKILLNQYKFICKCKKCFFNI